MAGGRGGLVEERENVLHFASNGAKALDREPESRTTYSQHRHGQEQAQDHYVRCDSSSMFHFCMRLDPLSFRALNESRTGRVYLSLLRASRYKP